MTPRLTCAARAAPLVFLFLALEAGLVAFVDEPLSRFIRTLAPALIDFFRAYTNLGKSGGYLWPSGLGALACLGLARYGTFPPSARDGWLKAGRTLGFFFLCVALSGIVTDMIKPILGRARPVLLQRENFYGFSPFDFASATYRSMPSGHATTAFAIAAALTALWPRGRWIFYAFALAVGLSRIMVNAHYLSDVIAGAAVGILTVTVLERLFRNRGWLVNPRHQD